jgi:hypothetical protein
MTKAVVRGTVLHCSRFGAVVRLDDGRLCLLPSDDRAMSELRRAASGGRRPAFEFVVESGHGRRARLALAAGDEALRGSRTQSAAVAVPAASSSFEQKIIDFLRQASEHDGGMSETLERREERARSERLLRFEYRDRRKPGDDSRRSRAPKR